MWKFQGSIKKEVELSGVGAQVVSSKIHVEFTLDLAEWSEWPHLAR